MVNSLDLNPVLPKVYLEIKSKIAEILKTLRYEVGALLSLQHKNRDTTSLNPAAAEL